jgi:TonB family protein
MIFSFRFLLFLFRTGTLFPASLVVAGLPEQLEKLVAEEAYAEVVDFLGPLVVQGDPAAQLLLGIFHDFGTAVALDPDRALELAQTAAEQGLPAAARYLAWKYGVGFGVEKDELERARYSVMAEGWDKAHKGYFTFPKPLLGDMGGDGFFPFFASATAYNLKRARAGSAMDQYHMGQFQLFGQGIAADGKAALRWYRQAAEQEYLPALNQMRFFYENGLLVEEDTQQALSYARRAAATGDSEALHTLAKMLLADAEKGSQEASEGLRALEKAAGQAYLPAIRDLAEAYDDGKITEQDFDLAWAFFNLGAAKGDAFCLMSCGLMLENGRGRSVDYPFAIIFYKQASDVGNSFASYRLASLYYSPPSASGLKPDYGKARIFGERAAASGRESAWFILGNLYQHGLGVAVSLNRAFECFEKGAREGHVKSQNRLGWLLLNGFGVEQDAKEAAVWFELAAKKNYRPALINLGLLYYLGHGVGQSYDKAEHYWFQAIEPYPHKFSSGILFMYSMLFAEQRKIPSKIRPEVFAQSLGRHLMDREWLPEEIKSLMPEQEMTGFFSLEKREPLPFSQPPASAQSHLPKATEGDSQTPSETVFKLSEVDRKPQVVKPAQPVYPPLLKFNGFEGSAVLEFILDAEGRILEPEVYRADHPAFGKAFLEVIPQWVLSPAVKGGRPVPCRVRLPIEFSISKEFKDEELGFP